MKLAVLGDIHGNIDALEKAYSAALAERPDEIIHLGDLGGYAPFVNEVVDFLMDRNIRGVQGNYDFNVAAESEHCGCRYDDPAQAALADLSFAWTKQHASDRSKDYMRSLPRELRFKANGRTVAVFHATPHRNNIYWHEDRPERFYKEMAEKADADIMIYGHTHKPYRKDIEGRVFVNSGSTGKPKDGDPRACLALLDISEGQVDSRFIRVAYDLEKAAASIINSGLPDELATLLREAR